ncbi:hypothetical protein D9758_009942 [Tetrapyrgos nigripes]|uniref:Carboxylic ester hydrolase n=1 Tax=Tetrapyrgos nigripes TaxID=182062 RepID=A0A8H5FRJ2_9AGAR|nr:hypothetical protein D9758_009942 [Tetrapyrgos nigripes]
MGILLYLGRDDSPNASVSNVYSWVYVCVCDKSGGKKFHRFSSLMFSPHLQGSLIAATLSLSSLVAGRLSPAQFCGADFDSTCSSIASQLSIPNATVFSSNLVAKGTNLTFPEQDPSCVNPTISPASLVVPADVCRIALAVQTSDQSGINMEAWLPRNWTGRFLSTGNGGVGGCIQYADMAYTSGLGFATVGANNGHNGTFGKFFLNNSDVLEDFVYRSIHTGVVVGKEITKTFYGSEYTKSYYLGCSTGGRQGLKSIQDFPEDFDGVVAGAPGNQWNNIIDNFSHVFNVTGTPDAPTFVPQEAWLNIIHPDIMKQCDNIDKVQDGVIEDPSLCNYDPSGIICSGSGDNSSCITAEQADIVRKVFSPFFIGDEFIQSRLIPGSEVAEPLAIVLAGDVAGFSTEWFRFVVDSNPDLDVKTLGESDWKKCIDQNPFNISTFKGDISAFKNRGGKLLTYHGQADGLISPNNSEIYYGHVSNTMGLSTSQMDDFYRLFRISGMFHCSQGPGAWNVGQGLFGDTAPGSDYLDPEKNVLMAAVRWVEEGTAPDSIQGTKFVNDTNSLGVEASRKHCKFPLRNMYDGSGDSTKPESWSCQPVSGS